MPSEAAKYLEYARKCIDLAQRASSDAERDKLVDLARVWMSAALTEEQAARSVASPSLDIAVAPTDA